MGFLRSAACWLGLSDRGWVRVRGLEVEVVITGDKRRVQRVALAVQNELLRMARAGRREAAMAQLEPGSAVVPVAIDEDDAPYVVSNQILRVRPRPVSGPGRARAAKPGFQSAARPGRTARRPPSRDGADADTELGLDGLLEVTEQ